MPAFGPNIVGLGKILARARKLNKAMNEEQSARSNANTLRQTARAENPTQEAFDRRRAATLARLSRGFGF